MPAHAAPAPTRPRPFTRTESPATGLPTPAGARPLAPPPADAAGGHPRRWQVLAVMCLALLVVVVDNTILNTALPTLARELAATTTDLQWITDAYTLVFAALLIVAGGLGDRFGRRGALIGGLAVFAAGSAAAALSSTPSELIAFRAVMGLGGAFVMPTTLSIINAVFPRAERAKAIGAWSAVSGIAVVVGPTIGGLLLAHSSWHSVFWINVPLALATLLAVVLLVPSLPAGRTGQTTRRQPLDILGAILSAVGMLAAVDAVIEAPARGWTSPLTAGEAALGLAAFAGFVAHELRTAHPLIDVRVFSHRAFSAASAAVALTFFAMFGSLFALTQYLQLVHGYSPLSAGLRALPFAAGVLLAAPAAPALVARLGTRVVIPAGLASMATGLFTLSTVTANSGLAHVSIAVALMGAGMGLVLAPAGESILSVLPEEQAGVGSALNDTVQELGGSLGVAVLGSLVSVAYGQHLTSALHTAHLPAAVISPASSSIAAANTIAAQLHTPALAQALTDSAHTAFTTAMTHGFTVAATVAATGAVMSAIALPAHHRTTTTTKPTPATTDADTGRQITAHHPAVTAAVA